MDIKNHLEERNIDTKKNLKEIDKWITGSIDKYIVKSIVEDYTLRIKFLDNTVLDGKVKWFNKYNINLVTTEGIEYLILKHSLKYMVKIG